MTPAQVQDVIEWDVGTWSNCLPFWAPALAAKPAETTLVLTVGERNGGLSLWFALAGYRVVCTDFPEPTNRARKLHRSHGVESRIEYVGANVLSLPFQSDVFGIVAAKSVIGGLKSDPRDKSTRTLQVQQRAANEIHRVLRSDGVFLGAENMVGSVLHRLGRKARHGKNLGWRHLAVDEIPTLFSRYSWVERYYHGFLGTHWRSFVMNRWAARFDAALCPILRDSAKYVGFFRAWK